VLNKSILTVVVGSIRGTELRLRVFQSVALIDANVVPLHLTTDGTVPGFDCWEQSILVDKSNCDDDALLSKV
jgi:hypothetical protein